MPLYGSKIREYLPTCQDSIVITVVDSIIGFDSSSHIVTWSLPCDSVVPPTKGEVSYSTGLGKSDRMPILNLDLKRSCIFLLVLLYVYYHHETNFTLGSSCPFSLGLRINMHWELFQPMGRLVARGRARGCRQRQNCPSYFTDPWAKAMLLLNATGILFVITQQ